MVATSATVSQPAGARPPGPKPRRGALDSLGYYYRFFTDSLRFIEERFEEYGDLYCAPSGGVDLFVLRHPDHIWEVLVRDGAKYGKTHTAFDTLTKFLGYGLLTTDGETWRRQRRMVQPAFSRKRLEGYARAMVSEGLETLGDWHHGQVRDMSREMMELTLRVVCRTLFSHDVRGSTDEVWHAMESFRTFMGKPALLPSWLPTPGRRQADEAVATLDRIIYGLVSERRSASASPDPPDLLQLLVTATDDEGDGGTLDDREIRDQLVTLFLAGHETTSHALTWTLYLLSQNPEAEAKLHAEVDEVLAGKPPTMADTERLPYTRWALEEAMRLYPPAYTLARRAEEDTVIGSYPVRAGSEVVVWIYMTHRDERWYPAPLAYRPERFAPELASSRPKCAYLPFGAGARACIGKLFAMIEGQLLLATLAQRFRFHLDPAQVVEPLPRITMAPKHGMRMLLQAR